MLEKSTSRSSDISFGENSLNQKNSLTTDQAVKATYDDDLIDFKFYDWNDQVHCEYDPPKHESTFGSWKLGRPILRRSWYRCVFYSFILTVICGAALSSVATFVLWLDLNLDTVCYQTSWYEIPKTIRHIRLTSEVAKGMIIQCWPLLTMLPAFGWNLVKKVNILPWTILASSTDAVYRLLLNVYLTYDQVWRSFPLNALFAINVTFSCYQIASHFRDSRGQRIQLAFILGAQFYLGLPVTIMVNSVIIPHFKYLPDKSKAIWASLCPAFLIIPKVVARLCIKSTRGINHPGAAVLLLIALHAGPPTVFRILQVRLEKFSLFIILCLVHGLESTFDKITLPIQDYILHWCHKRCTKRTQSVSGNINPRYSRLLADLAIVSIIAESTAIFVSSAGLQIFRYYYARNDRNERYDVVTLLRIFCTNAGIATVIEFLFNVLAIKIQTYFYNIPIIRVWKLRKAWILKMSLIQHFMNLLVFGYYVYSATTTKNMFDLNITQQCIKPFYRP